MRLVTRRANQHAKDEGSRAAQAAEPNSSASNPENSKVAGLEAGSAADSGTGRAAPEVGDSKATAAADDGKDAAKTGAAGTGAAGAGVAGAAESVGVPGGRTFAVVTGLPPLVLLAWLLPGLPLLLVHRFIPEPMALISLPLAVALIMLSAWFAPANWATPGRSVRGKRAGGKRAQGGRADREAAEGKSADDASAQDEPAQGKSAEDEPAVDASAKTEPSGDKAAKAGLVQEGPARGVRSEGHSSDGASADGTGADGSGADEAGAEGSGADGTGADGDSAKGSGAAGQSADGQSAEAKTDGEPSESKSGGRRAALPGRSWAAWWGLAGTVAVAVGFAAWQLLVNSAQFMTDRDPGAYLQIGYWIADHGSLPIPASLAAFGGAHPGLGFASFGFASHAGAIAPRLTAELPILLAAGLWTHGLPGGVLVGPVLGALGVLSVGGLTGRLAGPQWAPAGALLVALTLPQVYTSRSSFGETLTQALVFGGLCLVVDAVSGRKPVVPAALGGLALGLAAGVDVTALIMALPVIVFLGALAAGRRREALPFGGGLVVGAALGVAGAIVLTFPLLGSGAPPFGVMKIVGGGFVGVTVLGAVIGLVPPVRRGVGRLLAARPLRWLPGFGALVVAAAVLALAGRPYLQTVRGGADPYVAYLQRLAHLPVDPGRLYAEKSLYWVIWYLGVPALLLGVIGLALVTRLCLRALFTWRDPSGAARAWALPAAVIGWALFAVLWQPYTVPDQPWASRRLVPVVLPGLVVLAVWGAARLVAGARALGAGRLSVSVVAACVVAAAAVPPAAITFGIRPLRASTPEVRAALAGMALRRTGVGEYSAVQSLCAAIPTNASAVMLDAVAAREFTQVVRGMCGVPTAVVQGPGGVVAVPGSAVAGPGGALRGATPAEVQAVITGILESGRRPVLLATVPAELAAFSAQPRQVVNLNSEQDAHVLDRPPTSAWPVRYALWMSQPGGTPFGS